MNLCRSSVLGVDDMNRRQVISEIGRLRREYGVMEELIHVTPTYFHPNFASPATTLNHCALDSIYSKA